jgi:hypothetical protein
MKARYWTDKRPTVNAFDTETRHGDLLILCDPKECLEVGPGTRFGDILNFLWRQGRRENFFWNVGYDLGAILKAHILRLSPSDRRTLRAKHRVDYGRLTLSFTGDKGFQLRDTQAHRSKRFWDLAPFYSEENATRPLDIVAKERLGQGKLTGIDRERLGKEHGYYESHLAAVVLYCKQDARIVRELAELRLTEFHSTLGFYPTRFSSKASLSKAYLDRYYSDVLAASVPKAIDDAFHNGYKGGIFHTRILGRITNVTELDISSAYPSVIAELPDLRQLTPRISNEYHSDAVLGVYRIETIFNGDLPLVRRKGKRIVYPISNELRPYWATLPEIRYLIGVGRQFKIQVAYEYFGPGTPAFPGFQDLYERRQLLRLEEKHDLAFLLKIVMSACYGAFAESKHGETRFTNWVYAATITGVIRARIWGLCADIGWDRVVSINTDSVRFIGPSRYYDDHRAQLTKPGFGSWEEKFTGATLTHYQSGVALIEQKGKPPKIRKRGFKNLTPEMLRSTTGPVLEVGRKRAIKLGEALAQDRIQDLGDFQEEERLLDLRSNLQALDFPPEKLVFEYLNRLPLAGSNPDYDEVALPRRNAERFAHQRGASFRRPGGRNHSGHRATRD